MLSLCLATAAESCAIPKLEIDARYDEKGGSSGRGGQTNPPSNATGSTALPGTANTGGSASTGGTQGRGGTTATGGKKATGGTSSRGGTTATGGKKTTGGTQNRAGASSIGGAINAAGTNSAGVAPVPPCLGNPIPIPANGRVAAGSNGCGITGGWFWYKDSPTTTNAAETSVTSPAAASATPAVEAGGKACIKGSTVVDTTYNAWGAGIVLDLNNTGGPKQSYNPAANGIGGFEITVSGQFPQGLRVQFEPAVVETNQGVPFVPIAKPGTYRVRIADAFVPLDWDSTNAGVGVDPNQLAGLQIVVVGGTIAEAFDYCVESVIPLPIVDDGSMGTKPVTFVPMTLGSSAEVLATSNSAGIQGKYYCFAPVDYTCEYRANVNSTNSPGMCASGAFTTSTDNWGAVVGLNLNHVAESGARQPYDATTHKLRGFRVDTTNTTTGLPLRVKSGSTSTLLTDEVFPLEEFSKPGQHLVDFGSIACPNWENRTCTELTLSKLYFLEVELSSLQTAMNYDLCIMKLEAMVEATAAR